MPETVKRGYVPTDEKEFVRQIEKLRSAGADLYYLINRGYPIKSASVFIGNHYLLSERQRMALVRSVSPEERIRDRKAKEKPRLEEGAAVYIDGFNTIISLEIAFSGSTLLLCMDGTVRDLAGLRGTYRLIDKTDRAILAVRRVLEEERVKTAHFGPFPAGCAGLQFRQTEGGHCRGVCGVACPCGVFRDQRCG